MASATELIPCPGGCGNSVHQNATECPYCGYKAEASKLEDLLGSLSTVSSILTGFGLAALVQLAGGELKSGEMVLQWTAGLWIVSSVLLLAVLVGSEVLRRREVGGGRMRLTPEEDKRLWEGSEWLLGSFALALLGMGAGVVLLGFSFSTFHGIVGCVGVAVGIALIQKMW